MLEASSIRNSSNFDLLKCYKDGKPLILTGSLIDPSLYLKEI